MKNIIFLDTGVISLYQSNHKETIRELNIKKQDQFKFISSEVNYIELFNHLCREKGNLSAQIIMENLRKGETVDFISVHRKISILAGELKCKFHNLSMVDSIIVAEALIRKIFIYTTETHFKNVDSLKVKKFDY